VGWGVQEQPLAALASRGSQAAALRRAEHVWHPRKWLLHDVPILTVAAAPVLGPFARAATQTWHR
jgi:hypothetical protein